PSAVLVLLGYGSDGAQVLLTERASDLRDYPGQLVFPGGSLDPGDDDLRAAALREAHEEVGLSPESVEVLGELPAIALPETGFLVTPVLAWAGSPAFVDSGNLAEVASARFVPLSSLARRGQTGAKDLMAEGDSWDAEGGARARLGRMTRTVLDVIQSWLPNEDADGRPAATVTSAGPEPLPASPLPRGTAG
ncbi:MAG: CoA pyrophosphatase, partial [Intrasporangium sp.]|uniref:NUDIX hydrolase n=1 Tax=Intrasporangium sp. TaxID=1925024 RepID=UPI0026485149